MVQSFFIFPSPVPMTHPWDMGGVFQSSIKQSLQWGGCHAYSLPCPYVLGVTLTLGGVLKWLFYTAFR